MSDYTRLIIGLGKTGWSVARFFSNQGLPFRIMDTRPYPPYIQNFKQLFPQVPIHTGSINPEWIRQSQKIILSPGIDPKIIRPHMTHLQAIYSDLDLFGEVVNTPIIAITGSNGKSTVTVLIQKLLIALGKEVQVGGNLGTPVLDLWVNPPPDFYVLELSSFQLSITRHLRVSVSLFLNFSADHLDRHQELSHYHSAKQAIYRNCEIAIWNRDVPCTYPAYPVRKIIDFGSNAPASKESFGLMAYSKSIWLAQGKTLLFDTQDLKIKGTHNYTNVLAALAAVRSISAHSLSSFEVLKSFIGLSHRLEWVCREKGITWINDSKATNSHATQAALSSLNKKNEKKVILVAGGIHKNGDDLNALIPSLQKYIKQFILIGQAASFLESHFKGIAPIYTALTLKEAVKVASNYAISGDTILFSPACSSQDMFTDYAERGECFKRAVKLTLNLDKFYDK